jgi:hypothetical protein
VHTPGGRQEMSSLPLKLVPGWLFGISAGRVKEEVRKNIIRYRREAYDVLNEAMQEGRLTVGEKSIEETVEELGDNPAAESYRLAKVQLSLAKSQVLMQADIRRLTESVGDHSLRLDSLEAEIFVDDRHLTQDQASQLSQSVKAVAMELGKKTGRNEFGGVYGELYRRYSITSYKMMPAGKFQAAMGWLTEWHQSLVDDVEF